MDINQVLVTAQFCSRVTADGLEIVGRACLVEGVCGEVENLEMVWIFQKFFLIGQNLERFVSVFAGNEERVIAESFVHSPHVDNDEQCQGNTAIEVEITHLRAVVTHIGIRKDYACTE